MASEISSASAMADSMLKERMKFLLERLREKSVKTITLYGEPGIGKTWMAREISDLAIGKGLFVGAVWIYLNKKYAPKSLLESIACQMSLLCTGDELDNEDDSEEEEEEEEKKEEQDQEENLKQKIYDELKRKKYLLILDDKGCDKMNEEDMSKLITLIYSYEDRFSKVLITRRSADSSEETGEAIKVEPLTLSDSLYLLKERANMALPHFQKLEQASEAIIKKSCHLPAAIIVIAEALGRVAKHGCAGWTMERALERAINKADNSITDLFRCGYDMLPDSIMKNCSWYSRQLFLKHGGIHYNELITFWIMEGYLGVTDCIKVAYMKGHNILMELVDCGMLKIQADDIVTMEEAALEVNDDRDCGIAGTANLGLAYVFDKEKIGFLGRIALADAMIKTLSSRKKWEILSVLLIDGSRLCGEDLETFFQVMQGLRVLAIFKPIFDILPLSLCQIKNLEVLVLRGCELLKDISNISKLKKLTVLEISGAGLMQIPPNPFGEMPKLRSLNLSIVRINSLPLPTNVHLQLRWLILRGCSDLTTLPSLKHCKSLEVLDLSACTSLHTINNGAFKELQNLKMIDFSQTKIQIFPVINSLEKLNWLFLRSCQQLTRLPGLPLNIQVVDVSGSRKLAEFHKQSLEKNDRLKILDLSQTAIAENDHDPPSIPSSLSNLRLSGCLHLKTLPCTTALTSLELLDLSDASSLTEIKDKSFEHLKYLQVLNLSRTKVKKVPSLSKLGNLCQLLLSGCNQLLELPMMDGLEKLEVLNLSGCSALTMIQNQSFEQLSFLQECDLSGVCNLKEFDATFLKHMTHLRILNLSKTPLKRLSTLEALTKLEVLDLSGTQIEEFPYWISELMHLKRLNLPELKDIVWGKIKRVPGEFNFNEWGIVKLAAVQAEIKEPSTSTNATDYHFAIYPIKEKGKDEIIDCYRRAVYSVNRNFNRHKVDDWSLEIHGFHSFPVGFESVLQHAKYVSFIDTSSLSSLSDLDGNNVKGMKGCWLDGCMNVKSILHGEGQDTRLGENLEFLWASNLPNFRGIYSEDMQLKSFRNLKSLFLDCCPMLVNIFSPFQLPENLEFLEIKFCDKLENLFGDDYSPECRLDKLHTLHLFDLPELKNIGAAFPSLKNLKVGHCPLLHIYHPSQFPANLEVLDIKFCDGLATLFGYDKSSV